QKPKISPYKNAMEKKISEILQINVFKVNVKATTTEKLGFIGKGEGILVQASVVLEYFDWKKIISL
ncbi:2-C-methyl-D-erythritol 2,4-cyclodiphosphate synthase, partial [Helicobacter ganmani]|uniref:2-C-methyl-D-erythritol 2,4-cyclodiphosphate synthase n=2 Tax=Helicobacter TaxID=209 RepID=UPI003A864EA8